MTTTYNLTGNGTITPSGGPGPTFRISGFANPALALGIVQYASTFQAFPECDVPLRWRIY